MGDRWLPCSNSEQNVRLGQGLGHHLLLAEDGRTLSGITFYKAGCMCFSSSNHSLHEGLVVKDVGGGGQCEIYLGM